MQKDSSIPGYTTWPVCVKPLGGSVLGVSLQTILFIEARSTLHGVPDKKTFAAVEFTVKLSPISVILSPPDVPLELGLIVCTFARC